MHGSHRILCIAIHTAPEIKFVLKSLDHSFIVFEDQFSENCEHIFNKW